MLAALSLTIRRSTLSVAVATLALLIWIAPLAAQGGGDGIPTIESHTEGMQRIDGFLPLYFDAAEDEVFLESGMLETDIRHSRGPAAGPALDL